MLFLVRTPGDHGPDQPSIRLDEYRYAMLDETTPVYDTPERGAPQAPMGLPSWSGRICGWGLVVMKASQDDRRLYGDRAELKPGQRIVMFGRAHAYFFWRTKHDAELFYRSERILGGAEDGSIMYLYWPHTRHDAYGHANIRHRTIELAPAEMAKMDLPAVGAFEILRELALQSPPFSG